MGWASGDEVFDPVARRMQQLALPADAKTEVLSVLIEALQDRGWDTEGESLGEFVGDEAIVEAFRRNGIIIRCGQQALVAGEAAWCSRERGDRGHEDGQHEDEWHRKWPAAKAG